MTSAMRPRLAIFGAVLLGLAIALVLSWTNVGVLELGTLFTMVLPVAAILAIAFAGYKILVAMQSKDMVDTHDVA